MHAGTVSTKYDGKERVEHVEGLLSATFDIIMFFFFKTTNMISPVGKFSILSYSI